jgi:hypothetical protein
MKKKKKNKQLTRKELENKVFIFLWERNPELLIELFDLTERQLYDRVRYLGLMWKNPVIFQQEKQ